MARTVRSACLVLVALVAISCNENTKKKGTLCTGDDECMGALCLSGSCVALTACSTQSECGDGICAGGYCFQEGCSETADCAYGTCHNGYCVRESLLVDASNGSEDATLEDALADSSPPEDTSPPDDVLDAQVEGDGFLLFDIEWTKLVPCEEDVVIPTNSRALQQMVSVSWDPVKRAYESAAACKWECLASYCSVDGSCVDSKTLPCDTNNQSPLNAINKLLDVVVQCLPDGSFSKPDLCEWSCKPSFCREGDSCLADKLVPCDTGSQPLHAVSQLIDVVVACLGDGSFENPRPCEWSCDNGYVRDVTGNLCELAKRNCFEILQLVPNAPDGIYFIDPDGTGPELPRAAWCEMLAGGVTVEYGIGAFDGRGPRYYGWGLIGATHFLNPLNQLPFIALYNANLGALNLEPGFAPQSCCFRNDAVPQSALGLTFGGESVMSTDNQSLVCQAALDPQFLRFGLSTSGLQYPLLPDFFVNHPPAVATGCTENGNPAFFWRRLGVSSCADLQLNGFPSGAYRIRDAGEPNGERVVYCDMLGSEQVEFGVGAGEGSYANWSVVALTEWLLPTLQQAFIGYYNARGGILNLEPGLGARATCCLRTSIGPLAFGSDWVAPYTTSGTYCNGSVSTPFTDSVVQLGLRDTTHLAPPVADDFFASHPPNGLVSCGAGLYYSIFVRRTPF
ncbi:MAG: hypothetical protein KC609_09025 [Myxococcales bacterium]|nr:hypothetical protein [Myxococcales bacterium]